MTSHKQSLSFNYRLVLNPSIGASKKADVLYQIPHSLLCKSLQGLKLIHVSQSQNTDKL